MITRSLGGISKLFLEKLRHCDVWEGGDHRPSHFKNSYIHSIIYSESDKNSLTLRGGGGGGVKC